MLNFELSTHNLSLFVNEIKIHFRIIKLNNSVEHMRIECFDEKENLIHFIV